MAPEDDWSAASACQRALRASRVISESDAQFICLPGFMVPVAFDTDQAITESFLVPYFGACLHLPPPPPNQIIFARFPQQLEVEILYDPFVVEGRLKVETVSHDSAPGRLQPGSAGVQ